MNKKIFLTIVAFVFVIFLIYTLNKPRKRAIALHSFAKQIGYTYKAEDDGSLLKEFSESPAEYMLFNRKGDYVVHNILEGRYGKYDIRIFDLRFIGPVEDSVHIHYYTVFHMTSADLEIPKFKIYPKALADRIVNKEQMSNITDEEFYMFYRNYNAEFEKPELHNKILDDVFIKLINDIRPVNLSIESAGNEILFYKRALLDPNVLRPNIREFIEIINLVKRPVFLEGQGLVIPDK